MNRLIRYWFLFETDRSPRALNLGCGVSAYGYDDALALLNERVFKDGIVPRILELKENVDISLVDDKTCSIEHGEPDNSRHLVSEGIRGTHTLTPD
jgi:hypothetical protein